MNGYLIVFLGAGFGGALRHGINIATVRLLGVGFPLGTLVINVTGSLVMGVLVGWFAVKGDPGQSWRLFLTTGILGGFTTFSTFSLDTVSLYQRGEAGMAVLYVLASVTASLAGLFFGLLLVRQVMHGALP